MLISSMFNQCIAFYPQQDLTSAAGKLTQMETAVISVSQHRTPNECAAAHME